MGWRVGADSVRFAVPRGVAGQWAENWALDDDRSSVTETERTFSLPFAQWLESGDPPPAKAEPEELDAFRAMNAAIAALLELRMQHVQIETVGHIGAPDVTFRFSVGGTHIADADPPTPFPKDAAGRVHPLLPPSFVVYERLCRWNARRAATRSEQLVFVGELRDHLDRCQTTLADAAILFTFELDPHLREFHTRRVGRVALGWQPQKNAGVLDLKLEQVADDGTRTPLDLRNLDAASPLIAVSSTESILLDKDVEAVARVAKKQVNKLRAKVERHLSSPASILPEGISLDNIDLSSYSPRVAGFAPIVKAERFIDIMSSGTQWYVRDGANHGLFLQYSIAQPGTGAIEQITIASREAADQAVTVLEAALAKDQPDIVTIGDRRVEPTQALVDHIKQDVSAYDARVEREASATAAVTKPVRLAAVIDEDSAPVTLARDAAVDHPVAWDQIAAMLAPSFSVDAIKHHQRVGVEWLWRHFKAGQAGVLLADDMGLGKTLQIAMFLALQRAVEPVEPTSPTLIVCPVILLQNWQDELRKFFQPEVFADLIVLYGEALRQKRDQHDRLDLAAIRTKKYVLTNYETLQAHQQSLLTIDWNVVVLDEAHAIKNPDTYRARAARGLKRRFAIASTGTPVENRLCDLWALYDFLSPGNPFSTIKSFEQDYESKQAEGIALIRGALAYPSQRSSLLRRTKDEVLTLPPKTSVIHHIEMTPEQVELERSVSRSAAGKGGVLNVLQSLQKLYQHPRLLLTETTPVRGDSMATVIAQSPKLALCMKILRDVQAAGEKALVFTLWTDMQDLLVQVIAHELGLPNVRVINGDPKQRRRALEFIKEFSAVDGFSVLVLSPLAAGTGLTITAANHVIHYGRWWNPAKEDQATDRAYRIGQTRPVQVHYPLLTHPGGATNSFDVNLHALVERKRSMAKDFLMPAPETVTAADIEQLREA